jgi:hypothetical protein
MAGHNRPKDGVASLAYVPAIHALLKYRMAGGFIYISRTGVTASLYRRHQRCCPLRLVSSHQLHSQLAPNDFGGALKTLDRRATVVGIEQAVDLRAAGFHERSHALLGDLSFFHLAGKLARDHGFDRGGRDFFADAFLIQPTFETGP